MSRAPATALALTLCIAMHGCERDPSFGLRPIDEPSSSRISTLPPIAPPSASSAAEAPPPPPPQEPSKPPSAPSGEPFAGSLDTPMSRSSRALAGLPVEGLPADTASIVEKHAARVSPMAEAFEASVAAPMQRWAETALTATSGAVLYPFAGPDFPTVHRFYPGASRYVLVALQEGGAPPDLLSLPRDEQASLLATYQRVLASFYKRGFFITAAMGAGFKGARHTRGITPGLMIFAEREGYAVLSVDPVRISQASGELEPHPGDRGDPETFSSVRLSLVRRSDRQKVILDYVQLDLSDPSLRADRSKMRFLEGLAKGPVLVKAASHLMQQGGFADVRDAIVGGATELVEDETGVAYDRLLGSFDVALYGQFKQVNGLFDGRPQAGLKRAFAERSDIKPLPFSLGYRKAAGSLLIVARRKAR